MIDFSPLLLKLTIKNNNNQKQHQQQQQTKQKQKQKKRVDKMFEEIEQLAATDCMYPVLKNAFITTATLTPLDYKSEEILTVQYSFRYDWAEYSTAQFT